MKRKSERADLLDQLRDELALQAWLARAELRNPSFHDVTLRKEVDALAVLRDELRLQLHLGKLDARDRFEQLEQRWRAFMRAAADTAEEAGIRVRDALREIREGYRALLELGEEPTGA